MTMSTGKYAKRQPRVSKACEFCGQSFMARPNRLRKGKDRFCSISCAQKVCAAKREGETSTNWAGGTRRQGGYVDLWVGKGRYRRRYHLVVEAKLGRPLRPREVVHHINGIKDCDEPSNLFVFRHNAAHRRWHRFLERHGLPGTLLKSNLDFYAVS